MMCSSTMLKLIKVKGEKSNIILPLLKMRYDNFSRVFSFHFVLIYVEKDQKDKSGKRSDEVKNKYK